MTEFFFHIVFSAFLFIPSLHLPLFNNYLPESTAGVFQYLRKTAIYKFCHEKLSSILPVPTEKENTDSLFLVMLQSIHVYMCLEPWSHI